MDTAIVALLGVGGLGFIGYQFYSFFYGISGTRSEIERDKAELMQHVSSIELAPWSEDEADIISRFGESNLDRKLFGEIEHGVIYSIYHEPLIAFAVKHYDARSTYLLLFKINEDVYDIKVQNSIGALSKNGTPYGTIETENGICIHRNDDHLYMETQTTSQLIPVYINDRQIVSIDKDDSNDQSRVIIPVQKIDREDLDLFVVGLAFSIIDQHI